MASSPSGRPARVRHADTRGARPSRRMVCRTGERSRAGDRGCGLELHPGGHCARPPRAALRRRRGPGRDAVLQQAYQEGLYQHFRAINDAIGIPIIVYNIPARSVIDMSVDTMKRLFDLKNIAGVKDATANVVRVSQQRAAMGEDFNQLSGEDATALGFMAHGGHGCISVTSNVAPRLCAEFQGACLRGDYRAALGLQDKLLPLHTALFVETSPAPVKYALSVLGKCADTVRLPMVAVADRTKAAVREAMVHAGLIN